MVILIRNCPTDNFLWRKVFITKLWPLKNYLSVKKVSLFCCQKLNSPLYSTHQSGSNFECMNEILCWDFFRRGICFILKYGLKKKATTCILFVYNSDVIHYNCFGWTKIKLNDNLQIYKSKNAIYIYSLENKKHSVGKLFKFLKSIIQGTNWN